MQISEEIKKLCLVWTKDSIGNSVDSFCNTSPVVVLIICPELLDILRQPTQPKSVKMNTKRPKVTDEILFLTLSPFRSVIISKYVFKRKGKTW